MRYSLSQQDENCVSVTFQKRKLFTMWGKLSIRSEQGSPALFDDFQTNLQDRPEGME